MGLGDLLLRSQAQKKPCQSRTLGIALPQSLEPFRNADSAIVLIALTCLTTSRMRISLAS